MEVETTNTPKYCRVCGTRLVPNNSTVGFDPFTGEPELAQRLDCPNPTTEVPKNPLAKAKQTWHPSWSQDAVTGIWID